MTRTPKVKGGAADPVWFAGQEQLVEITSVARDELGGLVTIDFVHHKIHSGLSFQADTIDLALDDAATLILSTPDPIGYECHFTIQGQAGGDATLELIEGATPTGGVNRVAYNLNRNHADGPNCVSQPALAGGVVIAGPVLIPGGTGPKPGGGSLGTRANLEWETDPTEAYAIRLTNISGAAIAASIVVNFYR